MAAKRGMDKPAMAATFVGVGLLLLVAGSQAFGLLGRWVLGLTGADVATGDAYARAEWLMGLYNLFARVAIFALPYWFLTAVGRRVGLKVPLGKSAVPILVLLPLFLGLMVAINSLSNLFRGIFSMIWELAPTTLNPLPAGGFARFLYFLTTCVAAAILEEMVFRGGIQGLLRGYGPRFSIWVTSLLFTFMHAGAWELPTVFALSLLLGYVAEIAGSVGPCIVLHLANNLFSFMILLAQQEMETMAAIALTLWLILAFILLFIGAVWAVRSFKLGPRLKLRRDAPELGRPAARAGRLLAVPVFTMGAVAVLANFILRLF